MTRSQCKAKSSTASATTKKPPSTSSAATAKAKSSVAKSSVAAANANISGTTKGRGGGRKPSTANSTAAVEYTSEIVTRVDLGLNLPKKERPLKLEQTKSKLVRIIRSLGLSDIHTDLTPNDVEVLKKCIQLQDEDFRKLISGLVPGHKERAETRSTLFDHLRKAVFPAPSLALIPSSKKDATKKDDLSLRATYVSRCGLPPQFSNGWTQTTMIEGIQLQEDSESNGGDYHYVRLSDEELSDKVIQECGGKSYVKRWKMVRTVWQHDNRPDYTKSSQVRNVTVIEPDDAPAAAPSLSGGIGSTDANVLGSSDRVRVVPQTPRNLQNGNGVAPPASNIENELGRHSDDINALSNAQVQTNNQNDAKFYAMMNQMSIQNNQIQEQNNNIHVAMNEIKENKKDIKENKNRIDGLEREQVAQGNQLGAQETRIESLESQVSNLKTELTNTVRKLKSSGSDSSSDNNDGDESNSESVRRRIFSVDSESNECYSKD